jgi:hypothetical protein
MTWTPGPWSVDEDEPSIVQGPPYHEYPDQGFDNPADARLISLAPEMAEFLQRVVDDLGAGFEQYAYTLEAKALLARARGEDA